MMHFNMPAACSPAHRASAIPDHVVQRAVARLVRAAVGAREQLSARGIRHALEAEFACDLRASKGASM